MKLPKGSIRYGVVYTTNIDTGRPEDADSPLVFTITNNGVVKTPQSGIEVTNPEIGKYLFQYIFDNSLAQPGQSVIEEITANVRDEIGRIATVITMDPEPRTPKPSSQWFNSNSGL